MRTTTTNADGALVALKRAKSSLLAAREDTAIAADQLAGARATRARQLCDQIEQCIAWADRIRFYVTCDAGQHGTQQGGAR
jgi:hypothetical protein